MAAVASAWTSVFGGAVPEPSTWAMMLPGFESLGYAGYRPARASDATLAAYFASETLPRACAVDAGRPAMLTSWKVRRGPRSCRTHSCRLLMPSAVRTSLAHCSPPGPTSESPATSVLKETRAASIGVERRQRSCVRRRFTHRSGQPSRRRLEAASSGPTAQVSDPTTMRNVPAPSNRGAHCSRGFWRSSRSGILPIWTNRRSPSAAPFPLQCRREPIPISTGSRPFSGIGSILWKAASQSAPRGVPIAYC